MPRTVSSIAKAAVFAQQTGEAFLMLIALTHPDLPTPIRVTSDGVQTVSGGETYLPCPFNITLPSETDESPPEIRLVIDNVDRSLVQSIRALGGDPLGVRLEVVLASTPNVIEAGPFDFSMRDVQYDAAAIEGTLKYDDFLNEPYPGDRFTPSTARSLF